MLRLFSNIFLLKRATYSYDISKDSVQVKIAEILSKSGSFFNEPDIHGRFYNEYHFYIIAQPAIFTIGDTLIYTVLYGTIKEREPGKTKVETKIATSILFKFVFVFVLAIGVACFYKSYIQSSPLFSLLGIGMCLFGSLIINWIAGISKTSVQDRYERYIHKAIKKKMSS